MIPVLALLLLVALGLTIASVMGKTPLWAAVFVIVVANMLMVWGR